MTIKRIRINTIFIFAVIWIVSGCRAQYSKHNGGAVSDDSAIARAFKNRTSNIQVEGEGVVERILKDDLDGDRHQRFIVRVASNQTVLVVHNIDIAPRIDTLQTGDSISFYGEYVWNDQGGMVHWTHHDPAGRHVAGWLKYKGRTYQ